MRERVERVTIAPRKQARKLSRSKKRVFDIDVVLERIRTAIEPFAKAAMFELAEDGFNSVFEQLVA